MRDLILPALVAGAAITLTYLFCLRPMRTGHCAIVPNSAAQNRTCNAEERAELARLRRDVRQLRAELGAPGINLQPDPLDEHALGPRQQRAPGAASAAQAHPSRKDHQQ